MSQPPDIPGLTIEHLEVQLSALAPLPRDAGCVEQLCVRPALDARELRAELQLDPSLGAIGDRWLHRTWMHLPDGSPDPRVQIAIGNSRLIALIQRLTANDRHPGDTLLTDLDLSYDNLPPGALLGVGSCVLEVSDVENDACAKFAARHGRVVFEWIRDPANRRRRLRGLFARIITGGIVRVGDPVVPLRAGPATR